MFKRTKNPSLTFALLGFFLFVPFLGGVHLFDWDEMNFAEISREMMLLGDYSRVHINFEPFFEKPPLFFWLQVACMKVFGVNEFAARLPNAIAGIITLVLLFNIGERLCSRRFGIIWAASYGGSLLPFLYFKSGIIDPWFNLFIFLGIWFFILFHWKKTDANPIHLQWSKWGYLILGGVFIGLGILTKGPVALLLAGLVIVIHWSVTRDLGFSNLGYLAVFSAIAIAIMGTWFGIETLRNGQEFVVEFIKYQWRLFSTPDAGHQGFPGYHMVVILLGCFPASIFAFRAFFKMPNVKMEMHIHDFKKWMSILFWVVIVVFSIVQSKIIHYSSLCYFPVTFLAAWTVEALIREKIPLSKWMKIGLIFIAGVFVFATLTAPFVGQNIELVQEGLKSDPFAVGKLEADVIWTGWEIIPGLLLAILVILAFWFFKQEKHLKGYFSLLIGTLFFTYTALYYYIGKVEHYAQRAVIEFYKSKSEEDCYIRTIGYKAYGHLFYAKKRKPTHPQHNDKDWQMFGEVDKPVYFIYKNYRAREAEALGNLEEVGRKNGFVFFKRKE